MSEYVAIVGSRNTPEIVLELMIRLGRTYTDLGVGVSSGDAYDSDRAGWYGACQSRRFSEVGCRIFLNKQYREGTHISKFPGFIDAREHVTYWDHAKSMAFAARGNFNGLNDWGIELHTRNVYQVYGVNLDEIVIACIFYAKPKSRDTVSGGTNTAYQLAKQAKVPVIINLATPHGIDWAKTFLAKHELDYPYDPIDWTKIHKHDDPRLLDFEE